MQRGTETKVQAPREEKYAPATLTWGQAPFVGNRLLWQQPTLQGTERQGIDCLERQWTSCTGNWRLGYGHSNRLLRTGSAFQGKALLEKRRELRKHNRQSRTRNTKSTRSLLTRNPEATVMPGGGEGWLVIKNLWNNSHTWISLVGAELQMQKQQVPTATQMTLLSWRAPSC